MATIAKQEVDSQERGGDNMVASRVGVCRVVTGPDILSALVSLPTESRESGTTAVQNPQSQKQVKGPEQIDRQRTGGHRQKVGFPGPGTDLKTRRAESDSQY